MLDRRGNLTLFATAALALAVALPAMAASTTILPSSFVPKAIGTGSGSVTDDGKTLTIKGAGADIQDADADAFYFVSAPVTGDGNITAHLTSATGGAPDGGERVGLMIRGDLDPDSAHATINESNNNYGLSLNLRDPKGSTDTHESGYGFRTFPMWFRAQRAGSQVTGFFSPDGQLWSATNTKSVTLGAAANFGLAVASHDDTVTMTTTWDNVSVGTDMLVSGLHACGNTAGIALSWQAVTGATGYLVFRGPANVDEHNIKQSDLVQISKDPVAAATPAYTDLDAAVLPGTRAVYAVAPVMADGKPGPLAIVLGGKAGTPVSPLAGYNVTVIGTHMEGDCPQGSVGASMDPATGVVTVRGGGHDIWSDGDNYVLLSRKLSGDGQMTIQPLDFALGINATGCGCGKGGLILVEKAVANQRFAMASVRPDGLAQQYRDATDGTGEHGGSSILDSTAERAAFQTTGLWLRVVRKGDNIDTLYSTDGTNFQPIDATVNLTGLAKDVEIGVMITTRDRDDPIQNRLGEFRVKIID